MGSYVTKILGFHPKKKFGDPPYHPHYAIFGRKRGVFRKVVQGFQNLRYDFGGVGGRCLKVTLQKRAPENFRSCRWGEERTVKSAQTGSEDPHRRERKFKSVSWTDQPVTCV